MTWKSSCLIRCSQSGPRSQGGTKHIRARCEAAGGDNSEVPTTPLGCGKTSTRPVRRCPTGMYGDRRIGMRGKAARPLGLLGRAEQSGPNAALRRAEGAGLDCESADRAIINLTRCTSSSDTVREVEYQILHLGLRLRPEPRTTFWRYSEARGVAAFLLFLLPKPSDEAEQRQQMVPRAHSVAECRTAQSPIRCLAFYALHLELDPFPKVTAVTEAGCEKFPRLLRLSASTHNSSRGSPAWWRGMSSVQEGVSTSTLLWSLTAGHSARGMSGAIRRPRRTSLQELKAWTPLPPVYHRKDDKANLCEQLPEFQCRADDRIEAKALVRVEVKHEAVGFFDVFNASPPTRETRSCPSARRSKDHRHLEEQIRLARSILFTNGDVLDLVAKASRIVLLEEALLRAPLRTADKADHRFPVQGSITSAIVRQ